MRANLRQHDDGRDTMTTPQPARNVHPRALCVVTESDAFIII
jgi:hypothetical protein